MHNGTDRDILDRQCVAGADFRLRAGANGIAGTQSQRRDNVALFAVFVDNQRNPRRAVGIVLDRAYRGVYSGLVALEVDDAVETLMPTTAMARGDASHIVAPGSL